MSAALKLVKGFVLDSFCHIGLIVLLMTISKMTLKFIAGCFGIGGLNKERHENICLQKEDHSGCKKSVLQ